MIILLNTYANGKTGLRKWGELKAGLENEYLGRDYSLIDCFDEFHHVFQREIDRGERFFIAAGGDGTVNFLLNQMMAFRESRSGREEMILGAIGLGSSNDFHKSFAESSHTHGKPPVRLNSRKAAPHNVGLIEYQDRDCVWKRKYFIVNCSVGLVAQANLFFNSSDKIVNRLKSRWVDGAIWYAALQTLFKAKNVPAQIVVNGESMETQITSLSAFINPNVSGNFCYDMKITPQSNFMGVALCEAMGIPRRVKTLLSLAKGKFVGLPQTRIWRAHEVELFPASPLALEMDGEVTLAGRIRIKLLRNELRVCA
ncbi:MAG: hypothetical protein JXB23_05130 [Candidatus Aminicenantes bacterium]|nr:hypothetical protein [Candidatus Aminicenantes bacterium]